MCVSNENARLSESSSSPDSPPPSNAPVQNSQTEHSPMLHCPPLKDQPVNIPTSSTTLPSSTVNETSLAATAPEQMNEDWWSSVAEVLQASLPTFQLQAPQAPAPSISQKTVPPPLATEPVPAMQPRSKPPCNTTGPTIVRVPNVNIRWVPAETTIATSNSRPIYQRQLAIDETSEIPRQAKRFPPLKRKPAPAATSSSAGTSDAQSKRARSRAKCD